MARPFWTYQPLEVASGAGSRDPCCAGAAFGDGPADTARLAPPPSAARPSRKRRRSVRFVCESSDVDTGVRRMFAPELSRREDHNHPPLFLTFHTRRRARRRNGAGDRQVATRVQESFVPVCRVREQFTTTVDPTISTQATRNACRRPPIPSVGISSTSNSSG